MTNQATQIYLSMCERLYDRDPKQQPVPLLAAALPVLSEDKLSYTVQLRKGVGSTTARRSMRRRSSSRCGGS